MSKKDVIKSEVKCILKKLLIGKGINIDKYEENW